MPGKLSKMNMPEDTRSKKMPDDAEFDAEFDMVSDMPEDEAAPEMSGEDDLSTISDEALMAEIKKRGLSTELDMSGEEETPEFEMAEEEEANMEEVPAPMAEKKKPKAYT